MLTKDKLRIQTSKPLKDGSRRKTVYFNRQLYVSREELQRDWQNVNRCANDLLKSAVINEAYGQLYSKLAELRVEIIRRNLHGNYNRAEEIVNEIISLIK
jgi:uncharacterized protein YutE (UPF0331/DUF86 family)